MAKLGFTFYPKDWWTSDTFFELNENERYIFLECMFLMYQNNGYMKTQKTHFENRTRTQVKTQVWEKITSKFIKDEKGYTLLSVNKRMRKTLANRENGKLGGRPPKPKKPNLETQTKPTLERERERERENKEEKEQIHFLAFEKDFVNDRSEWERIAMKQSVQLIQIRYGAKLFSEQAKKNKLLFYDYKHLRNYFRKWIPSNIPTLSRANAWELNKGGL